MLWLLPPVMGGTAETLRRRPWASLGIGVIGFIGFFLLIAILLVMILLAIGLGFIRLDDLVGITVWGTGATITILGFLFSLAAAFAVQAAVGATLGGLAVRTEAGRRWAALAPGVLVVVVISSVPVVGGWIGQVIALFGLGGIILEFWALAPTRGALYLDTEICLKGEQTFALDWLRGKAMRIFDYGVVANWDERLASLAELAEPERWTYVSVPDESPHPVLDSYLRYTFLQLHAQAKVAELDELSCFNTGLLTPAQEEIFGVFTVSERYDPGRPLGHDNRKWFLKTWARSGDRILTGFASLPELASYWSDPAELIFNPNLEVRPNIDHILRHNLNRFPVELGGHVDANGIPRDLGATPEIDIEEGAGEAVQSSEVEEDEEVTSRPLAARIAMDGAVAHSIRLAQRSYRVAVPQFHRGAIQLLIPLYLRDAARADLALALEPQPGWYRAATVLYPDWAYRHARLLSRPNSEWLGGFRADAKP
jgi:hypothetical protein